MNEKNKKEIVKSMMNVEFSPCADIDVPPENCTSFKVSNQLVY